MSVHTEWDTARGCDYVALPVREADKELDLDGPEGGYSAPAVLVLGGAGGGCLAIEGTKEALLALASRILTEVQRLPDDLPEPPVYEEGDDEPDDSQISPWDRRY